MCYFEKALDPSTAKNTLDNLIKSINKSKIDFDFIVVRGMSGAIMANALVIALKKPVVIVRKKDDNSHGSDVEIPGAGSSVVRNMSYIFVDDGVSKGETLSMVISKMMKSYKATIKGVFLYCQDDILPDMDKKRIENTLKYEAITNIKIPLYDTEHGTVKTVKVA